MKKITSNTLIISLLLTLLAIPVWAETKNMLLCLPSFPGTSAQAQPYIDKVLRYLEKKLNQTNGSMSGTYLPDGEKALDRLMSETPELALVGPSVYVGLHKRIKMKVIAKVVANDRGENVYFVVTKKGGPSSLAELAGKKLSGQVVHDPQYVFNVLLDQKIAPGNLTLISQKRPLKSLRAVVRSEVDAAILDQSVIDHMNKLPNASELQIIYKSKPVPAPAAVVIGASKKEIKNIKTALTEMCLAPEGKELCTSLMITSIERASDADYKNLLKRYNR